MRVAAAHRAEAEKIAAELAAIARSGMVPRTMEHLESQLPAADVDLSDDVLDQIDKIVPPGVTVNPADNGWVSPALTSAARRR